MIILGVVLLVIGLLTGLGLLFWVGAILAIVGAVLAVSGGVGRPIGGRRWYY